MRVAISGWEEVAEQRFLGGVVHERTVVDVLKAVVENRVLLAARGKCFLTVLDFIC